MIRLSSRQLDAMREVTHGANAQAANLLAKLIESGGVWIEPPTVLWVTRSQGALLLGGDDAPVVAVAFELQGTLSGQLWWVLGEGEARRLGQRLSAVKKARGDWRGALAEAANLVASAHLSALGASLNLPLLPSPPELFEANLGALFPSARSEQPMFLSVSRFISSDFPSYGGCLMLVLEHRAWLQSLERIGVS